LQKPKRLWLVALAICVAIIVATSDPKVEAAPNVFNVPATADLDRTINADLATTATNFQLPANTTYTIDQTIVLKAGDQLTGAADPTPPTKVGPATDPNPTSSIVGNGVLAKLIDLRGANTQVTWVDLSKANFTGSGGTGTAIGAGAGGDSTLIQFNRIHDNEAAGITTARGHILDNEIDHNSTDPASWGYIAAGVKGVYEYEAGRNFVHDNFAHGLWGDVEMKHTSVGCDNPTLVGCFNVHDNVLSNNGRAGVRYESVSTTGGEFHAVRNVIQNNGWQSVRGGISIHDAADSYVASNTFGGNEDNLGVRITDSGRSDRPDTKNATIENNTMNGEIAKLGSGVSVSADNIMIRNNIP
jgi:hypothetical protein